MMKSILLIEDNKLNIEFICDILSDHYEVSVATDGFQGVQKALILKPDLILCDIMMPKLNGYEVLESLRQSTEFRNIPFIFITAKAHIDDIRKGMISGADDYITKPFTSEDLLQAIKSRFKRKEDSDSELKSKISDVLSKLNTSSSHELNTPLNGIIGFSDLLINYYDKFSKADIIEMLHGIKSSSKRLYRTTSNIILYGYLYKAINSGNYTTDNKCTDCNLVVKAIAEKLANENNRTNDLQFISDSTSCIARISIDDLEKISEELILNAISFSEEGQIFSVKTNCSNNHFIIEITDSGRGMSTAEINSISPYTQFNREYYEQQGLGLGLYIAKTITELNKGTFSISSEVNSGTKVEVCIPLEILL